MNRNLYWVSVKTKNDFLFYRKLNLSKIKVFETKTFNDVLYLKVTEGDLEKLEKFFPTYEFDIVKFGGIKRIFAILKKEYIFFLSLLIGFLLFIVLSNMVFKINIIHENKHIREIIKSELDEANVKILRFKKSYKELDEIRKKILDKYPSELDWMEFEVNGMVINVRVEERIITNTNHEDKKCNLVATKSGVISDILINDGEIVVGINDYVKKGDLLVKGTIMYNEEAKRYTCAKGDVKANVWYTVSVSMPFNIPEKTKTGKKRYNLVFEHDGVKKEIFKNRLESYESNYKTILKMFDFRIYLDKEMEIKEDIKTLTEEEALNEGLKKAEENILKKIGNNNRIVDKKVLQKHVFDSKMDIEVFVVANETISTEERIVEGIDSDVS